MLERDSQGYVDGKAMADAIETVAHDNGNAAQAIEYLRVRMNDAADVIAALSERVTALEKLIRTP